MSHRFVALTSSLLVAASFHSLLAAAAPAPLDMTTLKLSDFKGQTYYEAMTQGGGIKEALDKDDTTEFAIAGKDAVHRAERNFDPGVINKVTRLFKDDEAGLETLADDLEGRKASPSSIVGLIGKELKDKKLLKDASKVGLAAYVVAPLLTMSSGGGVAVIINDGNYFYNVDYRQDVKRGRSYGASPARAAKDPSDIDYLKELDQYLAQKDDASNYYRNMFKMLTQCSASAYPSDRLGQQVSTDFLTIYTAEATRHITTGLTSHPWENDLTEVSMIAAFSAKSKVVIGGSDGFSQGDLTSFFGVGSQGSGLGGANHNKRLKLQKAVTLAEAKLHPEVVQALADLIGADSDADLFDGLMNYLNNDGNQAEIRKNSGKLVDAVVAFLAQIRKDAPAIKHAIQ
jgi:hypothetical protein